MAFEASPITDGISNSFKGLLKQPAATAVGGAVIGAALAGAGTYAVTSRKKSTRKASRKTSRKSSGSKRKKSKSRSGSYARTAGKRRDTSTRRIRMTKNGQPYVILKSGKARFISKKSARASRKRKGGRY